MKFSLNAYWYDDIVILIEKYKSCGAMIFACKPIKLISSILVLKSTGININTKMK